MSLGNRHVQIYLRKIGLDIGPVDGFLGPRTYSGIVQVLEVDNLPWHRWSQKRQLVALHQIIMREAGIDSGPIDGIVGEQTRYAYEAYQNYLRDYDPKQKEVEHQENVWPRYKDAIKHFGQPGQNQTRIITPYPLKLAWAPRTIVKGHSCHEMVHDSKKRVMERILDYYGPEKISELRLDYWGGCLNVRKMRGGTKWSTHAWGVADDWDPSRNRLRWNHKKARLARPEYDKFFELWQEEGWISLGKERDFDWMHVQAMRF